MRKKIVDNYRAGTGKETDANKWDGTCFTCSKQTKRGFCKSGSSWNAYVRTPDLFCEKWDKKLN